MNRISGLGIALALSLAVASAQAQTEFPPPQGKGRVVVVASGASGPSHYETVSRAIAKLGYDVVLFDGNAMEGTKGDGVKTAILQAQQMPHALPGKVALVGFSLGGGMSLFYGTQLSDLVAGAVVWYPATSFIHNVPVFLSHLQVPVLMFAGGEDHYRDCCLIGHAQELAAAATAGGKSFQLIVYPDADHDFVPDGLHYNPKAYADGLERTAAALQTYLGN